MGTLPTASPPRIQPYLRFPGESLLQKEEDFNVEDLLDRMERWTTFFRSATRSHQAVKEFNEAPFIKCIYQVLASALT